MKTAVILLGNIRTWDMARPSFDNIFGANGLDSDVFVHTYDRQYGYHPYIQGLYGSDDRILTNEKIETLLKSDLKYRSVAVESHEESERITQLEKQNFHPYYTNMDSSFGQYRKFSQAIDMVNRYELEHNFKYDVIIKTRFDLVYNPIDFSVLDDNSVIIDSGNVFPNDCIVIGKRDNMVKIAKFIPNEFYTPSYPETSHMNPPHGLLNSAFRHYNLNVYPQKIMNHVIRKGGKIQYY